MNAFADNRATWVFGNGIKSAPHGGMLLLHGVAAASENFQQLRECMIPPFNDAGYLPAGVHPATLAEIAERFGGPSELRRVQMESVRWMVDLARRAGVRRIILNGSFVTDIMEPNDVDCALLIERGYRRDSSAAVELDVGLPFLEMKLVRQVDFDEYVNMIFNSDRKGTRKGMIEVIP